MHTPVSLRTICHVMLSLWPCLLCLFLPGLIEVVSNRPATDGSEFQAFYQENLRPIYRYIYSKVRNREEAEDLTSQVFLKAIRHLDFNHSSQGRRKWLYQVARTTITDFWRAHYSMSSISLETLLESDWDGPLDDSSIEENGNATERVHRILEALPEQYRAVLTCRFLLGLSIKETAVKLNLTEVNVKTLQFRGLKRAVDLDDQ
ncbi:MAG TPA: sigma-70 family RNA polymerase sigma factor [Ktedonobacteraceae bacterium]|nr:sigma-70 family RNA polymerase sigma factor [Ktedonobacteraceae bacterium]